MSRFPWNPQRWICKCLYLGKYHRFVSISSLKVVNIRPGIKLCFLHWNVNQKQIYPYKFDYTKIWMRYSLQYQVNMILHVCMIICIISGSPIVTCGCSQRQQDDARHRNVFCIPGRLCGESTATELWCFGASHLSTMLNKPTSCRWFEMPWRSCDVSVINVRWE